MVGVFRKAGRVMLDFLTWRDLAVAFVRLRASSHGWVVRCIEVASTGSVYVKLQRLQVKAVVRLSDHRPGRHSRGFARCFCVRHQATGRLSMLDRFLKRGGLDAPSIAEGFDDACE